jgi:putative membrane protein
MNIPNINFHKKILKNTFNDKNDASYQKFLMEELILRDHLAVDRTMLANETTFLSYIRTSLTVLVVGATLVHVFSDSFTKILGIIMILIGLFIFVFGYHRALRVQSKINTLRKRGDKAVVEVMK